MLLPSSVLLAIKLLTLVGFAVYAVFAGVLVRQEQLMANVIEEAFEPILRLLVVFHFIATVVLLALAFILL